MFARLLGGWRASAPTEAPPASEDGTATPEKEKPALGGPGVGVHGRQKNRNFSEVDFMDSGLGRSLTSELPYMGLRDSMDSLEYDEHFMEEFLLSKLQDAQRRLHEVREYKASALEGPLDAAAAPVGGKRRKSDRMFVASFRLPLVVQIGDDGEVKSRLNSGGLGLFSAFRDLLGRVPIRWLGAPGQTFYDSTQLSMKDREKMKVHFTNRPSLQAMGLLTYVPLFPDSADANEHQEFCNSVMWPLFHYIPLNFAGERMYQVEMFAAYKRVNETYAAELIDEWERSGIAEEDAMFWIHDFHLLLVPKLLRDRLPNARVGFFLHTPFPAGEVYRTLPPRKELLEGILGADLIGFHTYDYARHFLSACERLLGLTTLPNGVDNRGVFVRVGIYPFGIDADTFRTAMKKSSVLKIRDDLRESLSGKKIIVGVDRLDYIKGLPHKLLAVEHFLETHPEWIGRVVLLQVTTPSHTASEEYMAFQSEILEMIGRINGRFGTLCDMPIHYREHNMEFEELCALYAVADVALISSVRDGMNLVSYEYIMCQKEHHGVLILSEFAGAAQNLPGAVLCNPWNTEEVSEAIYRSLEMPDVERELKHQKLYRYVTMHTSAAWGVRFIDDLIKYATERRERAAKLIKMPSEDILKSYKSANGIRCFFLDYDGALRKYESQPELAEPCERLKTILRRLTSNDQNMVFIVTGRQKSTMLEWFRGIGVGLAVEHGFSVRWPDHLRETYGGQDRKVRSETGVSLNETWDDLLSPNDLTAMRDALQLAGNLLRRIEDCTPSSFLTPKESAYSWHFRDADPDFALIRAHDARQALEEVLAGSPMEVLMGHKILYVRPRGVNKGAAVAEILRRLEVGNAKTSWIFSVGDDKTDEDMFSQVYAYTEGSDIVVNTATVGRKTTGAKFFVNGVDEVLDLLERLPL